MTHCFQPMIDYGYWPQHDAAHRPTGITMRCWKCAVCEEFVKVPADADSHRRLELRETLR